jgi:hypothetical protein
VNVQASDSLRVFSKAAHPLTSALSGIFSVPSDDPERLKVLLRRMERNR